MTTELIKIRDPFKKVFDRRSYYTKIEYTVNNESIVSNMKIDTGADYTIIGLMDDGLSEYREMILHSGMTGRAYDASGTELKLYGYIVENFRLTVPKDDSGWK